MPIALAAAVAAALTLSACGRNGAPELPPQALTQPPPAGSPAATTPTADAGAPTDPISVAGAAATQNGFDANGNPKAPPGQRRPFLLDPLLR